MSGCGLNGMGVAYFRRCVYDDSETCYVYCCGQFVGGYVQ